MVKNTHISPLGEFLRRLLIHSANIFILLILLSKAFFPVTSWLIGLLVTLLGVIALKEFYGIASKKSFVAKHFFGEIYLALFLLSSFLAVKFIHVLPFSFYFSNVPWIILLLGAVHLVFSYKNLLHSPIINASVSFFGILYVGIPLKFLFNILYVPFSLTTSSIGVWWIAFLLLITKVSDIFGYLIGKSLGKRKISPQLSPKKTIEGFIAGIISSMIVAVIFYYLLPKKYLTTFPSLFILIILSILLSATGFFGDLLESLLKRDAGVKDSNKLPGVGGVLDNLDSLLFNIPLFYILIKLINPSLFL